VLQIASRFIDALPHLIWTEAHRRKGKSVCPNGLVVPMADADYAVSTR